MLFLWLHHEELRKLLEMQYQKAVRGNWNYVIIICSDMARVSFVCSRQRMKERIIDL